MLSLHNGRDGQQITSSVYTIIVANKAICLGFVAVPRSLAPRALGGTGPAVQQVKQPPTEEEETYTLF